MVRRFVEVTRQKLISIGDTARLECHVDAFPRTPDTIKWHREGYDIGKISNVNKTQDIELKTTLTWSSYDRSK